MHKYEPNNKWLNNFNQYPLRTEAIVDRSLYVQTIIDEKPITTGVGNFFCEAIIKYFNATKVHNILHGRYFRNLSYNLMNNLSDISINSRANNFDEFRNTEYMYPIVQNDMCIVVPVLPSLSPLQRIKNVITFRLMVLFLLSILLSIVMWYVQLKFNNSKLTIFDQIFMACALLTNVSIPYRIKEMKTSEKILFASWLISSLLLTSAFTAMFFGAMLAPLKKIGLNTPEEIAKQGKIVFY